MYLYEVTVFDDSDQYNIYVVANSEKEAEDKVYNMDCWSCIITIIAKKIDIVDGYRVKLEKVDQTRKYKKELNKMSKEDLLNIEKLLEEE